jgi:Kef-type K+ transport system membrane component KefB
VFFPRGIGLVCVLIVIVLAGAALVARRFGPERSWLVPIGLLLTTYPHLLVVWHQSGIEVDRHALEAALLLRLGLLLLAAFAIDRALAGRERLADPGRRSRRRVTKEAT